jgi:hypothetical protein
MKIGLNAFYLIQCSDFWGFRSTIILLIIIESKKQRHENHKSIIL